MAELLGLAPWTVSKHMAILRQAPCQRPQVWAWDVVREAVAWVRRSLAESRQAAEDAKKLEKILAVNQEILCKRQNES